MMNEQESKPRAARASKEESHATKQRHETTAVPTHASEAASSVAGRIEDGIAQRLSDINEIEADIIKLVRATVSDTLRAGGDSATRLTSVVENAVTGAIQAVERVGSGLTMSAKNVASGIVMGVHDVGGDIEKASADAIRSLIRQASAIGADVGTVTKRAVDGIIAATEDIGENVATIGKRTAEGAIEEAEKISNMAVKAVKEVLTGIRGEHPDSGGTPTRRHEAPQHQHITH